MSPSAKSTASLRWVRRSTRSTTGCRAWSSSASTARSRTCWAPAPSGSSGTSRSRRAPRRWWRPTARPSRGCPACLDRVLPAALPRGARNSAAGDHRRDGGGRAVWPVASRCCRRWGAAPDIHLVAEATGRPLAEVAGVYFGTADRLRIGADRAPRRFDSGRRPVSTAWRGTGRSRCSVSRRSGGSRSRSSEAGGLDAWLAARGGCRPPGPSTWRRRSPTAAR
jgi:hypothetical protein